MAQWFNYKVNDLLLKLTTLRPKFTLHVFQGIRFVSALSHLLC